MTQKIIADNVKYYRNNRNLSQYDLAELADVNEKTITRAESGKVDVTLDVIQKISKALNVPLYTFFVERKKTDDEAREIRNIINNKLETFDITKLNAIDKMINIISQI